MKRKRKPLTDAQKANNYAHAVEWNNSHPERRRELALRYYYRNRTKANNSSWRYDQEHYQERLEYFRDYHRRKYDAKRKGLYRPRLGARVPQYAENAAHARSLISAVDFVPVGYGFANDVLHRRG